VIVAVDAQPAVMNNARPRQRWKVHMGSSGASYEPLRRDSGP
jgi:hypothetical protein